VTKDGIPKLVDFGHRQAARARRRSSRADAHRCAADDAALRQPRQVRGDVITTASDV
jgi:hypothetical protein